MASDATRDAMTTAEVLTALEETRRELGDALDRVGDRATTLRVTDEGWTPKDVLAHLLHWSGQIAFGLGASMTPPSYVVEETQRRSGAGAAPPNDDEWNALAVAHYQDVPFDELREAFERVADEVAVRASLRTDAEMAEVGVIPWAGERPLWLQIGGESFLHWREHASSIEAALSRDG
jgi:hypothetical protein